MNDTRMNMLLGAIFANRKIKNELEKEIKRDLIEVMADAQVFERLCRDSKITATQVLLTYRTAIGLSGDSLMECLDVVNKVREGQSYVEASGARENPDVVGNDIIRFILLKALIQNSSQENP